MPLVHCRSLLLRAAGPAHRRSFHRYGWRALPGADPASSPGRGAIGAPVRAGQGAIACVASVGRYRRKTVWLLFASHSVSPEMLNAWHRNCGCRGSDSDRASPRHNPPGMKVDPSFQRSSAYPVSSSPAARPTTIPSSR